jgi:hypothetical protein
MGAAARAGAQKKLAAAIELGGGSEHTLSESALLQALAGLGLKLSARDVLLVFHYVVEQWTPQGGGSDGGAVAAPQPRPISAKTFMSLVKELEPPSLPAAAPAQAQLHGQGQAASATGPASASQQAKYPACAQRDQRAERLPRGARAPPARRALCPSC